MKKNFSRFLSAVLAIVMVAAMLPATGVLAADVATSATFSFVEAAKSTTTLHVNYKDYGTVNPNWKYFDRSQELKKLEEEGDALGKTYSDLFIGGKFKANTAMNGGTAATDVWNAFKIKTTLQPGEYELSFNLPEIYAGYEGGSAQMEMYFAPHDEAKTSGADYMTAANCIMPKQGISAATKSAPNKFYVTGAGEAEYVLVIKLYTAQFSMTDFTLTRTGDLPESAAFTFTGAPNSTTLHEDYTEYGTINSNWKYFDRSQELKDLAEEDNILGTTYSDLFYGGSFKVNTSQSGNTAKDVWNAFKIKTPLKEGKYELSFNLGNIYGGNEGGSAQMEMYLAPYDATKTSGEDYMTAANCIMPKQGISTATTSAPNKFDVPAGADEFILVIKLYTAQFQIYGFEINKATASEVVYDFREAGVNKAVTSYNSYEATGRNWHWLGASPELEAAIAYSISFGRMVDGNIEINPLNIDESEDKRVRGSYHAFKLKAPEMPGVYALTVDCNGSGYLAGRGETDNTWIYVAEYGSSDLSSYITSNNLMNSGAKWNATSITGDKYIYIDGTEEDLVFLTQISENNSNAKTEYNTITLTPVEVSAGEIVASAENIKVGAKANVRLKLDGKEVITSMAKYSSDTPAVAQVSANGVVEGIKAGTATITVSAGDISATKEITVLPDELLSGNVSVFVKPIVDCVLSEKENDGIEANQGIIVGHINSVARGESITLTASGIDGKEFKYWQTASNIILSEEKSYTFDAYSNTAIFGVYESEGEAEENADVTIRFFSGFGNFIKTVALTKGNPFSAFANEVNYTGYRGHELDYWKNVDGQIDAATEINKNDVVVAQYKENPATNYNVTGIKEPGMYAYDEVVTAVSGAPDFSYWTRNGDIVSYNPTYTFSVWGDTAVEEVCDGTKTAVPAVILDNDGDVYMTEYSLPEGYTFVGAGIVFSNSGTPSINSCTSKASSKKASSKELKDLHGQFAARPLDDDETVARGYVVYVAPNGELVATYSKTYSK